MKIINIIYLNIIFIKYVFGLKCLSCNNTYFTFKICVNEDLNFNHNICTIINNKINNDNLIKNINIITPSSSKINIEPSSSTYENTPSSSKDENTPSSSTYENTPSSSTYENTPSSSKINIEPSSSKINIEPSSSPYENTPSNFNYKIKSNSLIHIYIVIISCLIILLLIAFRYFKKNNIFKTSKILPYVSPEEVKIEFIKMKRPKDYIIEFLDKEIM